MELDSAVTDYYARGGESSRLSGGLSLELIRTQVLLSRYLPDPPARVLDVGGATGVYASWLADRGYRVHLIDPVPSHVEAASAVGTFTAAIGDARGLAEADECCDAVLLLGPLYHLVEAADRIAALQEAYRVLRPGGVLLAAAISRYASTFDGLFEGFMDQRGFIPIMREDLSSGQHRNPGAVPRWFTTSYFHDSAGLAAEVKAAGLQDVEVVPVEGPFEWAPNIEQRLAVPEQKALVLDLLAAMEADPAVRGATAHLMAVGRR